MIQTNPPLERQILRAIMQEKNDENPKTFKLPSDLRILMERASGELGLDASNLIRLALIKFLKGEGYQYREGPMPEIKRPAKGKKRGH